MATVYILSGSGNWTCPPDVTSIKVECWGPGGKGGYGTSITYHPGGGGGSYAQRENVTVVPSTGYAYSVGSGSSPADTTFNVDGTITRGRPGTSCVQHSTTPGAGAVFQAGDGDVGYSGGDGGSPTTDSAGGGGGAGSAGNGQAGTAPTGGLGGFADGGKGGDGKTGANGSGDIGFTPGGGGGGIRGALSYPAANGGNGLIRLAWEPAQTYPDKMVGFQVVALPGDVKDVPVPANGFVDSNGDPVSLAVGDVLVALLFAGGNTRYVANYITLPAGWTEWGRKSGGTRKYFQWAWNRLSSVPTSWTFTASPTAGDEMSAIVLAYRGCAPTGDPAYAISDTDDTTSDNIVRAASMDVQAGRPIIWWGFSGYSTPNLNAPAWMRTIEQKMDGVSRQAVADYPGFDQAGPTGDLDGQTGASSSTPKAIAIQLRTLIPPDAPTITAPEPGLVAAPGAHVALTASSTQFDGLDIRYVWSYSRDGGAETPIGETALTASGQPATYSWDTTGATTGQYTLMCRAVASDGGQSELATASVTLTFTVLVAPADESSHISGEISLTGKGYLSAAGQLRLQWEVDSHNPPDPESADYDLITSALVDQGEEVSVTANATHLGTWYARARTLDTADATSAWTAVRTIYVLERLRLLPGSQVKRSLGKWANRVYCVVEQSSPLIVAVATNTTVSPTYAESPREIVIVAPPGSDLAGAQAIANAHLVLRPSTQLKLSGLQVRLVDGMKLARGQRVGIVIERDGIDATLPIIELTYDVSAAVCEVTVGNWWEPKTMSDYLLAIAQKVQQLEKEAATA